MRRYRQQASEFNSKCRQEHKLFGGPKIKCGPQTPPIVPAIIIAQELELSPSPESQMLKTIARFFANDLYGKALGVAYSSPTMGHLVSSATLLRVKTDGVHLSVNMRRPDGKTPEEFRILLDSALKKIQLAILRRCLQVIK